ncbi:hypothetical protein ASPACDRAFT_125870 [Aspergillus aculeatus ATCC 16872]|uniref:Invertebrate defensins family profile domain-containing protein n=1 Tax=Aspergillus aculeatus (strain ATCC 16872 / CBS 172.66 / WB 5094) TaxID=690307 RepID=A0A1L9WJI0_ASPA1|nr:uncharacterized protein ASPACDRAFT_125870 [Aspergillus aculeatus ATCC 16872]OJJ96311.1 hypothetical protein ASPACDRAFT_125870 [Aspergillus aculeatus ATCC 16872]
MQFSSIVTFTLLCAAATASSLNAGANQLDKRLFCNDATCNTQCLNANALSGQCGGTEDLRCICSYRAPLADTQSAAAPAGPGAPATGP